MPENRYWIQEDSLNVNTHKQAVLTRLLYEMPEKIYGVYIGIYWFWKIIFFKLCMHHVESCVMIVQPITTTVTSPQLCKGVSILSKTLQMIR